MFNEQYSGRNYSYKIVTLDYNVFPKLIMQFMFFMYSKTAFSGPDTAEIIYQVIVNYWFEKVLS